MPKLLLAHIVEPFDIGGLFARSSWPIHITLVPWFITNELGELLAKLSIVQNSHTPIQASVGHSDSFGPKANVPVSIIVAGPELQCLHEDLANVAKSVGSIESEKFLGKAFRPHTRRYKDRELKVGQKVEIDHFELIELLTPNECKILESYGL